MFLLSGTSVPSCTSLFLQDAGRTPVKLILILVYKLGYNYISIIYFGDFILMILLYRLIFFSPIFNLIFYIY